KVARSWVKSIPTKEKQLLTVEMKKKRMQWAITYKEFSVEQWKNVLFSDETHFFLFRDIKLTLSVEVGMKLRHQLTSFKNPNIHLQKFVGVVCPIMVQYL
ncbi:hypothetical protein J6590_076848, partial [Homalodisca vitripennis]